MSFFFFFISSIHYCIYFLTAYMIHPAAQLSQNVNTLMAIVRRRLEWDIAYFGLGRNLAIFLCHRLSWRAQCRWCEREKQTRRRYRRWEPPLGSTLHPYLVCREINCFLFFLKIGIIDRLRPTLFHVSRWDCWWRTWNVITVIDQQSENEDLNLHGGDEERQSVSFFLSTCDN